MNTIDQRKLLFESYIKNKEAILNDEVICDFFNTCQKDDVSSSKYFLPFFLATFKHYSDTLQSHISDLTKWYSIINFHELDILPKSGSSYSDLAKYAIDVLKISSYDSNQEYASSLIDYYLTFDHNLSDDSHFFVMYNLCKYYYILDDKQSARNILIEIIKYKRDWYIEMLPFKYHDFEISKDALTYVYDAQNIDYYDFNIILKYLNDLKIDTSSVSYIDNRKPTVDEITSLKQVVTQHIMISKLIPYHTGKLMRITKTKAGFISFKSNSYYINPKQILKHYKVGMLFVFITFENYNKLKGMMSTNATIIMEELK